MSFNVKFFNHVYSLIYLTITSWIGAVDYSSFDIYELLVLIFHLVGTISLFISVFCFYTDTIWILNRLKNN